MKLIIYSIAMVLVLIALAHAGDHFGEYLNDQVPQGYEYPLWMTIFSEYVLRLIIGGMIFFSLSGCPENKLLSFRGVIGIITSLLFLALSVIFHDVYNQILEIGIKGIALLIGGLLLLGFILPPILNALQRFRHK